MRTVHTFENRKGDCKTTVSKIYLTYGVALFSGVSLIGRPVTVVSDERFFIGNEYFEGLLGVVQLLTKIFFTLDPNDFISLRNLLSFYFINLYNFVNFIKFLYRLFENNAEKHLSEVSLPTF